MSAPSAPLPQPAWLTNESCWVPLRLPVSDEELDGDWRAYPHMWWHQAWQASMEPRVKELEKYLNANQVMAFECTLCKPRGVGNVAGFCAHVVGRRHYKYLSHVLTYGVRVNTEREKCGRDGTCRAAASASITQTVALTCTGDNYAKQKLQSLGRRLRWPCRPGMFLAGSLA